MSGRLVSIRFYWESIGAVGPIERQGAKNKAHGEVCGNDYDKAFPSQDAYSLTLTVALTR